MKPEQYPTTHTIARKLLEMEDVTAVLLAPVFDSPMEAQAMPVAVEEFDVQGRKCVVFRRLRETDVVTNPATTPEA